MTGSYIAQQYGGACLSPPARRPLAARAPQIREHLKGLALANEFEIEGLRKAPVELKLRQLWTLMTGAELLTGGARREIEVCEVRERWLRLHRAPVGCQSFMKGSGSSPDPTINGWEQPRRS